MSDQRRLEEELLSQEAEKRLVEQLDKAENVDVDIQTDLGKIVQGKVDGVGLTGKGLVIQKDIRVQEIRLITDEISINPISAILGQIKLNQPIIATARIVLTEADLNHTLKSQFVRSKIQGFDVNVDGKIVNIKLEEIQLKLFDQGQLECQGRVLLNENGNSQPLGFTARLSPRDLSPKIKLQSFNCIEGEGISVELILAFVEKMKEVLSLPQFELEDMKFRVLKIEIHKGEFILLVEANLREIPQVSKLEM